MQLLDILHQLLNISPLLCMTSSNGEGFFTLEREASKWYNFFQVKLEDIEGSFKALSLLIGGETQDPRGLGVIQGPIVKVGTEPVIQLGVGVRHGREAGCPLPSILSVLLVFTLLFLGCFCWLDGEASLMQAAKAVTCVLFS